MAKLSDYVNLEDRAEFMRRMRSGPKSFRPNDVLQTVGMLFVCLGFSEREEVLAELSALHDELRKGCPDEK